MMIPRGLAAVFTILIFGSISAFAAESKPNIVIIFADDLGYGDLGVYGHPTIRTPELDRMAGEGQRWTQFYSAACVCTPSRAALLTGRHAVRSGMAARTPRVLFHNSVGGLPSSEITIAEALKARGYSTAAIGKWHLGHLPQHLPMKQGFDSYFGIPYSNDMDHVLKEPGNPKAGFIKNVPLMRNEQVVERPAEQTTLTQRYTDEAVKLIQSNKKAGKPFFIYLAHTMPHTPIYRSKAFEGTSLRGVYGDVVEELDANIGRVLQTLRDEGLAQNTVVFFTSDNGPWLIQNVHGGSAGLLRDGKGGTWEGGMREPFIAWAPGRIKPGVVRDLGCTMDLFNTCIALAGGDVPTDRPIDGYDLSGTLFRGEPSPRHEMIYYRDNELYAARLGDFKAHFITEPAYGKEPRTPREPPLLYHLGHDPSEQYDVAAANPKVIADIRELVDKHRATLTPVENQLEKK